MNVELVKRRRKMLQLRAKGIPLADAVNLLSDEFKVSKQGIYKDWHRRKTWMPLVMEISDRTLVYLDLLAEHQEISRLASLEYLRAHNSSARVGALRLKRDLNNDLFEMLFLGDLIERVEKLELSKKPVIERLEENV